MALLISKSFELSTSPDFLKRVIPDLAQKLASWPPSSAESLTGMDAASFLVVEVFDNLFTVSLSGDSC